MQDIKSNFFYKFISALITTVVIGVLIIYPLESQVDPSLGKTYKDLFLNIRFSEVITNLLSTLGKFFIGYTIALSVGLGFGLLLGVSKRLEMATSSIINVMRPIPSIAVIPLSAMFFQYGSVEMTIFVVFYGAFWPVLMQVHQGVKDINPILIKSGKSITKINSTKTNDYSYRENLINNIQYIRNIVFNATLPALFVGARIAIGVTLLLVVTCEMLASVTSDDLLAGGLGFLMNQSLQSGLNYPMLISIIVTIGITGFVLDWIFSFFEKRLIPWHSGRRKVSDSYDIL
ncbi:ABC transporter permease [Pseudoalteromonas sp. T1lg23B]|uniref:ABC transporter permease n=1 Tax=Pseudoalteromonas sp. T1lg23B TaxID=2077097 RepID=UPI000CF710EF|nr:hypothetical protein [Pseudoalteromonas sp. T1lg23B]